jgi:hypothetical protein
MSVVVEVIVTSMPRGQGPVVPYSHEAGLQFYNAPNGVRTNRPIVYDVPVYAVLISGGRSYVAVRFGLKSNGTPPSPTRPCDTGLSDTRACVPGWLPHYSPHSFRGTSRRVRGNFFRAKDFSFTKAPIGRNIRLVAASVASKSSTEDGTRSWRRLKTSARAPAPKSRHRCASGYKSNERTTRSRHYGRRLSQKPGRILTPTEHEWSP